MGEILRGRDCVVHVKGDSITVVVNQAMVTGGWTGGQGVKWVDDPTDEFVVTYSDGPFGGFLVWGSDEPSDRFTAMSGQFPYYRHGVMLFGGNVISTISFEKYTYASRIGGGALTPLTYSAQDQLFLSLRGLWTKEDEWALSGDPRAPNDKPTGVVVQPPKVSNKQFMTIQTFM